MSVRKGFVSKSPIPTVPTPVRCMLPASECLPAPLRKSRAPACSHRAGVKRVPPGHGAAACAKHFQPRPQQSRSALQCHPHGGWMTVTLLSEVFLPSPRLFPPLTPIPTPRFSPRLAGLQSRPFPFLRRLLPPTPAKARPGTFFDPLPRFPPHFFPVFPPATSERPVDAL